MINIAICDDDKKFIDYIEEILQEASLSECDVKYYEYLSGEALIADFDNNVNYDLLILNVQMQDMDGNEVAVKFHKRYIDAMLVFCSGIYSPMPLSLEVLPFRYLLKQFTKETMIKELKEIVKVLKRRKDEPYIVGSYYNNMVRLHPREIMYVSIAKSGSNIYVNPENCKFKFEDRIRSRKKLSEIYNVLKDYDFAYAHNSYIVNFNYIKRKTIKEVELINGEILTISRAREKEFRDKFDTFREHKYN